MKNVYFVQANNVYGTEVKNTYIPYSVGCIQAYCQKNEIISSEYRFGKFIYTREAPEKVIELLDNPFMVLFSCSVWNTEYNKTVAKAIKEAYPSCLITFGGHNVSNNENYLRDNDFIDFLTHRFGEEPTEGILESLATGKSLDEIPNISYRNEAGEIVTTAYAPQTGTDYPSPYLEGTFDEILKDDIVFSALFETNRGCPNSCSFCDWGSLKSKVRLFPMERVFAEIDWFVEHKIEFVFCTDGNFCLFNRDEEIADYIVHCKNTYGYPKMFRVCFTKNKFDFVFDIGTKFFKNGLDKAQTLSFQSMNEQVLKNVGRKNISTEKFRELMLKYNEINISTFSELILGLPGETYETFCEGVNILIENGQHYAINIYPCELLPNAEMGQKAYQEKFGIKSTRVPFKLIHSNESQKKDDIVEYSEYITST
ncbi:MAG: radical SAM protein, partial [Clostridia bacterium]|nr:radical SAM protein [Clostridia bacterium]